MYEEQLRQHRAGSNPLLACMIQQQKLRKLAVLLYIIMESWNVQGFPNIPDIVSNQFAQNELYMAFKRYQKHESIKEFSMKG